MFKKKKEIKAPYEETKHRRNLLKEKFYLIPPQYSSTICVPVFQKRVNLRAEVNNILKKQFGNIPVVYDFEFTKFYKDLKFLMLTIIAAHKTQVVKGKKNYPIDYFYLKAVANMAPVPVLVIFKYPDEELYELGVVGNKKIFKISDRLTKPPSSDFVYDFYKSVINSFRSIEIVNIVIIGDEKYKLDDISDFEVEYADYSDVEKNFSSSLNIFKGHSRVYLSPEASSLAISIIETLTKRVIGLLLLYVLIFFVVFNLNNYKMAIENNIAKIKNIKNEINLEGQINELSNATNSLKTWVNVVKSSQKKIEYLETINSILYQKFVEIKSINIDIKNKTLKVVGATDKYENVIDFLKFIAKLDKVKSVSYPELKKYETKQDFITVVELYE